MDNHNNYTPDIEQILENIRMNSILLHKAHKKRYLELKDMLKYYKIPIIFISSISSIISFSQDYIEQKVITVTNTIMSLVCSLIGALELYMGISNQMVLELSTSKDYHILAMDIYKMLALQPVNRSIDGKAFLEQIYGTYVKLVENSCVVRRKLEDKLCEIPKLTDDKDDSFYLKTPRSNISPLTSPFSNEYLV